MKKQDKKRSLSVLAAALFTAGCVSPALLRAEAGVAPIYMVGTDSSEILPLNESPVELLHEKLVFDACGSSDVFFMLNPASDEEYPARFTAEYTLFNPTETDQTLNLAYTLGMLPDYAFRYAYEEGCETLVSFAAAGEELPFRTKYAYNCNDFGEITDPFFSAETPLTDQTITVSLPAERDKDENYLLRAECEYNPARTRLTVPESLRLSQYENGRVALYLWIREETQTLSITSLGEEAKITSLSVVPNNYGDFGEPLIGASAERGKIFRTTFGDYATGVFAASYPDLSEEDALRCGAQYYAQLYQSEGNVLRGDMQGIYPGFLSRRFEYELTVPAGKQFVHTVKAPLFPLLDQNFCTYTHDFSPAYGWAKYGGLSVEIRTDGATKLYESNFDLKAENGTIALSRDSLPMGNLSFGLCPISVNCEPNGKPENVSGELVAAFVILGVLAAGGIAAAVVAVVRKKRRKENERGGNS